MENSFSGFVGRRNELDQITNLIGKVGGNNVCIISGEGGVGKTWLLKEVHSLQPGLKEELVTKLIITRLLDLANQENLIPLNFEHLISNEVGSQYFGKSKLMRDDYTRMQIAEVSAATVEQHLEISYETFIEEYNSVSKDCRIVILVDTVDLHVISADTLLHFVTKIVPRLDNTLVIFAGREGAKLAPSFRASNPGDIVTIQLTGFSTEEADLFFNETEVGQTVSADLRKKIHFLSKGKPILIGLAVTWLERDMPIPQIEEMSIEQLKSLPSPDLKNLRNEFEEALVRQISSLGEDIHLAILEMAHLEKRFDLGILKYLHDDGIDNSAIMEELSGLFFVKHHPGEIHLLHDEMRELVKKHVWKYVDPLGSQRRELSRRIVSYYDLKILENKDQIAELTTNSLSYDADAKLEVNSRRSRLERVRWLLSSEKLFYQLGADIKEGVKYFSQEFDTSTAQYLRNYSDMLIREITPYLDLLKKEDRYNVYYRLSNYYRETGSLDKSRQVLNQLWTEFSDDAGFRIGILQSLASCDRDAGLYEESIVKLHQALDICRRLNVGELEPRLENVIGMSLVSMGKIDEAVSYYKTASDKAKQTRQPGLRAVIMNNLGYALSILGDHENSILYCEAALEIRISLDRARDIAMSYATLGSIHRDRGNFEQAYQHYQEALKVFEANDDKVWISTIRMERGIARAQHYEEIWYDAARANDLNINSLRQLLENAAIDLQESIKIGRVYNPKEMAKAVHELGHIYWELGDLNKAEEIWKESLLLAQESQNLRYILENIIGFAELDYDRKCYETIEKQKECLRSYDNETTRRDHALLWGRIAMLEGHALFDQEQYDQALPLYADAYQLLAKHGGWGRYRLSIELMRLAKKMDSLPPDKVFDWCNTLRERWAQDLGETKGKRSLMLFLETREIKAEQRGSF